MHNAYINVDNRKMSKSLNNFFTVRDVAAKYSYNVIRFFLLSAHYRSPMNFSDALMEASKSGLERITTCVSNLDFLMGNAKEEGLDKAFAEKMDSFREAFKAGMDDDLNTADGIAAIFDAVKEANSKANELSKESLAYAKALITELCSVLGVIAEEEKEDLDSKVEALIKERAEARSAKNYKRADEIRDELKAMGIVLEDTAQGVKWKKA